MRLIIILLGLITFHLHAFVPPVSSLLKDIFDNRKLSDGVEFGFSHQVSKSSGDSVDIEERILLDSRGLKFLWRVGAQGPWLSGRLEKRSYMIGADQKSSSRSLLFVKYFTSRTPVEFRDALINERFLRWDQLKQFKDGFELTGEPQTWDIKNNYIQHDSISFYLLPSGPSISVVGYQDSSSKRVFYLDKEALAIKRLEWIESSENSTWNFNSSMIDFKGSFFPRAATLSKDGKEIIHSELLAIRVLNKKQVKEWMQLWQKGESGRADLSANDENLRFLLSSR